MANRWRNNGNHETLVFWGSKITADCYCSHEIKRLLGRKAMTNIHIMIKSKDSTLSTKGCLVKAMVFLVVMYGRELDYKESWAPKNWCFWTVVLEKTLKSPWTARRSNQSILKEISPGCSLERLMLRLKLQYFGHQIEELTHLKRPWCWIWLRAGGEGVDRGWDGWMASLTQWTWVWVCPSGCWWWTGRPGCCVSWGCKESDMTEWLNWTELRIQVHQI